MPVLQCATHARNRLFPTFFLGGYECATPINSAGCRIDELLLTHHARLVEEDYRLLRRTGISTARDGVRWNLVDCLGRLDFSSALPFVEAAERQKITVIWDLFHYGYPADLNPFEEPFVERFCAYARGFSRLLVSRGHGECEGVRFYTPVNEISYFAWAAGDQALFAPHARGRAPELKRRLAEAAIRAVDAIRDVDPLARFVHCDPIVRVVAPRDAPWLEEEAHHFNERSVFEAWDMLAGRLAPELGGSPRHLDIMGVNYYGINQWEWGRPDSALSEEDPRRQRLSALLKSVHRRYGSPLLISETTSTGDDRPRWLTHIVEETLEALAEGVDLHGICIYPVVGMADWHTAEYCPMGLWDIAGPHGDLRLAHGPTLSVVARSRQRLDGARQALAAPHFTKAVASR